MPRLGDIGLVPGGGWIMRVVRWVTRSPYGHAFVYVGGDQIVEAKPTGARVSQVPKGRVFWCTCLSRDLTWPQRQAIAAWAHATTTANDGHGTPYSWVDDAEIGLVAVFHWAPRWMRRRLASDQTLMCSQLCVAAYRAAGVILFPGKPDGAQSPGALWRADIDASKRVHA